MPGNHDWSRIALKADSLLTSSEAQELLACFYYTFLAAVEQATDTATLRHQLHEATWRQVQKLCDSLPELLPSTQYPELVRHLWRVLDAGMHRTCKDAQVRRQVYGAYQVRILGLQQRGYDIGGSGQ